MMKYLLAAVFLLYYSVMVGQLMDTTYYNSSWEKCEKSDASFFRLATSDSLLHVKDYYVSGNVQMKGAYLLSNTDLKDGVFSYYREDGSIYRKSYFANGERVDYTDFFDEKGLLIRDLREADELDESPQLTGGYKDFGDYITQKLVYPSGAQNNGIMGRVYVKFWVMKDGSVGHVKLLRGAHPDLDSEALRLVKKSPLWKPGMLAGNPVIVEYIIPFNFVLE